MSRARWFQLGAECQTRNLVTESCRTNDEDVIPEKLVPLWRTWLQTNSWLWLKSYWTKYRASRAKTRNDAFNHSFITPLSRWCDTHFLRTSLEIHSKLIQQNYSTQMKPRTGCQRKCRLHPHSWRVLGCLSDEKRMPPWTRNKVPHLWQRRWSIV